MATLRRRLGDSVVAALKGGDALIDIILAGAGAALNVELAEENDVEADDSLLGHCRVEMVNVERVPFAEGEARKSKRRVYPFRMIFEIQTDVGIGYQSMDLWQALDRIFRDPRTYFRDYVTDTENNLASKAGRLELDEDFIESKRGSLMRIECTLRITVSQVADLTD